MIKVKKASGELEPFSEDKVRNSLKRAGTDGGLIDRIVAHIKNELYDGISTKKIYSHIFELLKRERSHLSSRYNLKRAIMELGPTGYPFEKFVGALLSHYGYAVETGVTVSGKCVKHEVDVVALKDNQHFMVECKFHTRQGLRTDVKVALYVKARFDDVVAAWRKKPEHQDMFHQVWLVTNTKLTSDAIQYGECVGMKLIAWSYPQKGSLQNLIEDTGLHPITCLSSLTKQQKQKLFAQDIVLCRDVMDVERRAFRSIGVSNEKVKKLREEIELVCHRTHKKQGVKDYNNRQI